MNNVWLKRTVNYQESENIEKPTENKTLISGPNTLVQLGFLLWLVSWSHQEHLKLERFLVSSSLFILAPNSYKHKMQASHKSCPHKVSKLSIHEIAIKS